MRLSLITVKHRPDSDDVSRRETLVEGETLRVGRGADVDVNLPDVDVAYHHATLTETELARDYATPEALRAHPRLAKFFKWVAKRPPDFHSKTPGKRRAKR